MKTIISLTVLALFTYTGVAEEPKIEPTVRGDVLTFWVHDLNGYPVDFDDARFKGKVVLVDIWGTWCPPCRKSAPFLENLHLEFADEGLVIVGIAFEKEIDTRKRRKAVKAFAAEYGIHYDLLDGGSTKRVSENFPTLEGFRAFPTMILIGRDGLVIQITTGFYRRNIYSLRKEIEKALFGESGSR